ncbi:MAG TPA: glucosyl-3-phosphoglycerate synthase [Solirubrobacteraceae bacterium]|nr:glucosyl-3-phosphoglycerate synthase [Solirubrobacteraceae bacterium]
MSTHLPKPDARLQAVVVVPARNEAERIGACLQALAGQLLIEHDDYEVVLVLDGCTDATRERALEVGAREPRLRLRLVELPDSHGVGHARRLGMDIACERLLLVGRTNGLIASTDADSVVAEDWLMAQIVLVRSGAQAIGGRIELHAEEANRLPEQALEQRRQHAEQRMSSVLDESSAQLTRIAEHHQFSGASLALTVAAYRHCGGLPARAALEDEALERELRERGVEIHRSESVRVRTSARTGGRAPRGLAHELMLASWRTRRTFKAADFPLTRLLEAKRESIALILPAREVAGSIGPIAECVARLCSAGLIDEALVVDAASADGTADIAAAAGIDVVQEDELAGDCGPVLGKGDAMWRALGEVDADVVAFIDTDTVDFDEHFITGLLGPLICEPSIQLVKGTFARPFRTGSMELAGEGGRVTELLARPLLNLHAPELAVFDQPLAGEVAARAELLRRLPFSAGYGVEIAMLIDAWHIVGLDGLAQVDLGVRQNRHQPLRDLSAMAYAVLVAASRRLLGAELIDAQAGGSIALPPAAAGAPIELRRVPIEERPPRRIVSGSPVAGREQAS